MFLDALYYAIDGNFHAKLKDKPMDEDDLPLSKAFFQTRKRLLLTRENWAVMAGGRRPLWCAREI